MKVKIKERKIQMKWMHRDKNERKGRMCDC